VKEVAFWARCIFECQKTPTTLGHPFDWGNLSPIALEEYVLCVEALAKKSLEAKLRRRMGSCFYSKSRWPDNSY
jgi:hypothetical protein